jgi:hypothetical protein
MYLPGASRCQWVLQGEDSQTLMVSLKIFARPDTSTEYQAIGPAMSAGGPARHHSVSDFGGDARTFSASNLQNFYATQRHQPSRASEAEQVMQAKRRMAAQRERELRNYHQEQQYNRSRQPSSE